MKTLLEHLIKKHIVSTKDNDKYGKLYSTTVWDSEYVYLLINSYDELKFACDCLGKENVHAKHYIDDLFAHNKVFLMRPYKGVFNEIEYRTLIKSNLKDCKPMGTIDITTQFNAEYWNKNKWCTR